MEQVLDALAHGVPVALRFAAECLVDGLHVVEQVRAGVEEAGLVFDGHLVAQPQRALDGDAGVAEIGVVEDLRGCRLDETAVELHDFGDLVGLAVARLRRSCGVCRPGCGAWDVVFAGIEKLNLALAALLLAVGDDPDVGADAGVVEHLLRQGDDGLQPVVLDDPLADVALAGARAAGRRAASR